MRVVFSEESIADLEAVVSFIARRDEDAAAKLGDRILDVIDALAAGEYDGPELTMETGKIVRSGVEAREHDRSIHEAGEPSRPYLEIPLPHTDSPLPPGEGPGVRESLD